MTATFFHGASNVRIGGNSQFTNIVAGRDAHQTNYLGDVHNNNSNNKTRTVIQDSFNDNSRSYVGPDAHKQAYADRFDREGDIAEDDGSEWTDGSEEEQEEDEEEDEEEEEQDNSDRHNSRRRRPGQKRPVNRRAQTKSRTKARPRPSATPQQVQSEPDVRTATPPPRNTSPPTAGVNVPSSAPAHVHMHTTSAPAVPTQASLAAPSTSPYTQPHLAVPHAGSVNASSTSFTQTSPSITQAIPSQPQSVNHPGSAPTPASSELLLLTSPSSQTAYLTMGHVNLSARYRYLVARDETRDEIRRMLVNVAQSAPKDKFFVLKDQAARASKILHMIEKSDEKIQSKKEVVYLSLESHAITFVAIMAAQTQAPDKQKVYNLLRILDDVEQLLDDIIFKQGISKWKPIKRGENLKLIKLNRERLVTWLQDFQNDASVKIDFALHEASTALAKALDVERQYQITVRPPSQGAPNPSPANSHLQTPVPSTGATGTTISNVSRSAVSLGSGSASVINADGDGNKTIYQNSHNNNSRNYYQ